LITPQLLPVIHKITNTVIEKIENIAYGYVFTAGDCIIWRPTRNVKSE